MRNKIIAIEALDPGMKKLDDFLPLVSVSLPTLKKAQKIIRKERDLVPGGNRIYYFSKRLNVEPMVVSKVCELFSNMLNVTQYYFHF